MSLIRAASSNTSKALATKSGPCRGWERTVKISFTPHLIPDRIQTMVNLLNNSQAAFLPQGPRRCFKVVPSRKQRERRRRLIKNQCPVIPVRCVKDSKRVLRGQEDIPSGFMVIHHHLDSRRDVNVSGEIPVNSVVRSRSKSAWTEARWAWTLHIDRPIEILVPMIIPRGSKDHSRCRRRWRGNTSEWRAIRRDRFIFASFHGRRSGAQSWGLGVDPTFSASDSLPICLNLFFQSRSACSALGHHFSKIGVHFCPALVGCLFACRLIYQEFVTRCLHFSVEGLHLIIVTFLLRGSQSFIKLLGGVCSDFLLHIGERFLYRSLLIFFSSFLLILFGLERSNASPRLCGNVVSDRNR